MNIIYKYYLDSTVYNIALSFLIAVYAGIFWSIIVFGTLGTLVGFIGYEYFKKEEYYFYYNYGYSKRMLITSVWTINFVAMIIGGGVYVLIVNLL